MKALIKLVWTWLLTVLLKPLVLYRTKERVEFSFGWFTVFVLLQTSGWIALVLGCTYWLSPEVFTMQIQTRWQNFIACFAVAHTVMGLFEYLFHRYTLHSVFAKSLWFLQKKHNRHHGLTHVKQVSETKDEPKRVRNKYPILSPEQIESSAFPGYSLVTFWGIISLLIIPMQLVLKHQPILITGYLAVTFSFWLYEVKHAIEHLDYEKNWRKGVERSKIIREIYGFHLMHHFNVRVNEAIGGVFGFPLWDILFRTYYVPKELPLPGVVLKSELVAPKPIFFIRWLDAIVSGKEARIKKRAGELALSRR